MRKITQKTYILLGFVIVLLIGLFASVFFYVQNSQKSEPEELLNASDFEKAEYYFTSENYDITKARTYYEASIRANPQQNPRQWYQLARINFIQGDLDSALYRLNKQTEYHGDLIPNVHYVYGLVYGFRADLFNREEDFSKAAEHFLKWLEYMPDSQWGRIDLSWVYFSQRKFPEMVAALEPVYEQEQDNPWFLNMYGLAMLNTKESKKAVEYLTRAAELASQLQNDEWGAVYPGNDPKDYPTGLAEFRLAVDLNLELAEARVLENGDNSENIN